MKSKHMKGWIAAPFTPMHSTGSLNLSIIPDYYQMLKSNGVKGVLFCGSTGEGVSLTQSEKKAVASAWAEVAGNDSDFMLMTLLGGTSIEDCKELALSMCQSIGLDAISFTAPFYFKPADVKQLAKCCIEVASVVPDMPFYYYHIPILTGVNFQMIDLLKELLAKLPNFTGIKYTHEDFMISSLFAFCRWKV